MCFAESPSSRTEAEGIDRKDRRFTQVTSCGPGPVSLPGAFISWGYLPGLLVGPVSAFAQAFTLSAISTPQWPRSGAISKRFARARRRGPAVPRRIFGDLGREPADPAAENQW